MNATSLKFNFSIWDLFILTSSIALMLALPVAAMEIVLTGAMMVVELGILLIIPVWIFNSRRSEPVEGGERIISQLLLRIFAVAFFVAVFGLIALACRQPIFG